MSGKEYTEPFNYERWENGEPAYSIIYEYIHWYSNEQFSQETIDAVSAHWRMKGK